MAFRFVYGVAHPQCVQQRTQDYGCPFCSIKCRDLLGLRYHLAASHDIFLYEVETGSLTVIWVRRRMEVYDERGNIFCPLTKQFMNSPEKVSTRITLRPSSEQPLGVLHEQGGLSESQASD